MTAVLRVENLTVDVGNLRIVDGLDLELRAGERVALVGESGSGKSMTARALLRLDPSVTVGGQVWLGDRDLVTLSEKQMQRVRGTELAMVFQDPSTALNPLRRVGDQVAEPLRIRGVSRRDARRRAAEMLDRLGVPRAAERLNAYPHEFSGGMRQRVMLAAALITGPRVLIADEPTTALDVRVQEKVLALIEQLAAEDGIAVLLITHDLGIVAGFADRVAVMYAGRKVEENSVETFFAGPSHPYGRGLLNSVPRVDRALTERLDTIPGTAVKPSARPPGCSFHPRCSAAVSRCSAEAPVLVTIGSGQVACHEV
ncbi:oligopeptide/dipeptide ABC transporter ATP-binding protein [Actinoplanes lutulentus]|uniref:Peptide/nickel transport system ATP-binding protein n=1 Tax=Actinoplanes lutulentus TaxID=1287878 RepID=A0A327Z9V2_9ACTN|nr:ABC transporter ATP-binding protein [Actinoplanes lutulentus]MBB2947222.1 oligopeptide/dipeptide ABC transporter ATP-binding protein [Actinoplanes lutulentus]RAK36497.1 peptide/nickel transport system ATP-binding protein [Actinoplanes lutulentus]